MTKDEMAFDLDYMVCFEVRFVRCYMLRHRAPLEALSLGDSFSVHLLADDREIGSGWSKDDAAFAASVRFAEEVAAADPTPCTCAGRHVSQIA